MDISSGARCGDPDHRRSHAGKRGKSAVSTIRFVLSSDILYLPYPALSFYGLKRCIQRRDQIVHIFYADGKTDRIRLYSLIQQFLLRQLRMRRAGRMDDQGFHISHVGQQREDWQIVDKLLRRIRVPLDLKGKDGTLPRSENISDTAYGWVRSPATDDNRFHLRMAVQIIHDLQCIFHVLLHAYGKSLKSLKEKECMERGKAWNRCRGRMARI